MDPALLNGTRLANKTSVNGSKVEKNHLNQVSGGRDLSIKSKWTGLKGSLLASGGKGTSVRSGCDVWKTDSIGRLINSGGWNGIRQLVARKRSERTATDVDDTKNNLAAQDGVRKRHARDTSLQSGFNSHKSAKFNCSDEEQINILCSRGVVNEGGIFDRFGRDVGGSKNDGARKRGTVNSNGKAGAAGESGSDGTGGASGGGAHGGRGSGSVAGGKRRTGAHGAPGVESGSVGNDGAPGAFRDVGKGGRGGSSSGERASDEPARSPGEDASVRTGSADGAADCADGAVGGSVGRASGNNVTEAHYGGVGYNGYPGEVGSEEEQTGEADGSGGFFTQSCDRCYESYEYIGSRGIVAFGGNVKNYGAPGKQLMPPNPDLIHKQITCIKKQDTPLIGRDV